MTQHCFRILNLCFEYFVHWKFGINIGSCYNNFGTGKKAKAAADPKQLAITQFFKKQKQ